LGDLKARIIAFNGEIGIIFYDAESKIDGKALSLEIMHQLKQQGLIKPHRPYYVDGDDRTGIKISLFSKSFETKRMVNPDDYVVAIGDTVNDTFLTDQPNDKTFAVYLGFRKDMKDHPSVIVALNKSGGDRIKESGTAAWLTNIFDVMEHNGTWADVNIINGLYSVNQLRSQLPDKAMEVPGGINFDPVMMDLQVMKDGHGVPLPLSKQPFSTKNIDGFVPVIINIVSINVSELINN
jgi:hypothetical protein